MKMMTIVSYNVIMSRRKVFDASTQGVSFFLPFEKKMFMYYPL